MFTRASPKRARVRKAAGCNITDQENQLPATGTLDSWTLKKSFQDGILLPFPYVRYAFKWPTVERNINTVIGQLQPERLLKH